jgi:hypothetical protein
VAASGMNRAGLSEQVVLESAANELTQTNDRSDCVLEADDDDEQDDSELVQNRDLDKKTVVREVLTLRKGR